MEIGILAAGLTGAGSLAAACVCLFKLRKNRELIEYTYSQVAELENSLTSSGKKLESAAQRINDQSRRIAWLETRLRQPKAAKKEVLEEAILTEPEEIPGRVNITERRHRVLSLASSGQNAETIAATLGMLPGEVELIIGLNRASFARFA